MKTQDYFIQRYKEIIPDFEQFLKAIATEPEILLRPNKIKYAGFDFEKSLSHYKKLDERTITRTNFRLENYHFSPDVHFSLGGSLEHTIGHFYSQNYSSQLAVDALNPSPGESILDLCAAPGGKTVLLAQRMKNQGMLVANEIYRHRSIALKGNLDRMGVVNCVVTSFNGVDFPTTRKFDKCLLDGPCSAEGTLFLSANSKLPFANDNEFRKGLVRTQKKLILKAYELLAEGGEMVYSTCTYAPEENEMIVQYLLEQTNAKLLAVDLNENFTPGLTKWNGEEFCPSLSKTKRVYPHKIATGGFYLAKISK